MNNMDVSVLAYAAGIIDGEGSFSISPHKDHGRIKRDGTQAMYHRSCVSVAMRDDGVIDFLDSHFDGYKTSYATKFGYRIYRWQIASQKARIFCEQIIPYLVAKRGQAELLIEFQLQQARHRTGEEFNVRMVRLNSENSIQARKHLEQLMEMSDVEPV